MIDVPGARSHVSEAASSPRTLLALSDALAVLLFAAYVLFALRRGYDFVPDDGYFYFKIGQSLASGKGLVFGAGIQTNGFHPFWLLICAGLSALTTDPRSFFIAMFGVTAALNSGSCLLVRFGFRRWFDALPLSLGVLFSMPYFLFAGVGMESALASFFLVLTVAQVARFLDTRKPRALISGGIAAGLAIFARLDTAIIILPLALTAGSVAVVTFWRSPRVLVLCALGGVLAVLPVAAWLVFNHVVFASAVPISGKLKLAGAAGWHFTMLTGVVKLHLAVLCASLLVLLLSRDRRYLAIAAAGAGQILYVSYLIGSGQKEVYSWYFVTLAIVSGLNLAAAVDFALRLGRLQRAGWRVAGLSALLACMGLLSTYNIYRYVMRTTLNTESYMAFAKAGAPSLPGGAHRVLAFDRPGQLAFFLGWDVIALDGLTTNLAFQRALREGGIAWLFDSYRINAFVGPTSGERDRSSFCDGALYIGAMRFTCTKDGQLERVQLFSRLDGAPLGAIELKDGHPLVITPNPELSFSQISSKDIRPD